MRTTLDIDDDVLAAAKELAAAERKTAGKVISELARKTITGKMGTPSDEIEWKNGLPLLPSKGNLVTSELVNKLLDRIAFRVHGNGRFFVLRTPGR